MIGRRLGVSGSAMPERALSYASPLQVYRYFWSMLSWGHMKSDFISIIEAAYTPAATEQAWLQGIADASKPCLDAGLGLNAYTYDATDPQAFRVVSCAGAGATPMHAEAIEGIVRGADPRLITRLHVPGPPAYFSQISSKIAREKIPGVASTRLRLVQHGTPDVLAIRGSDPSMRGCLITTYRSTSGRLSPAQARVLTCIGAHVASGWRLRQSSSEPDRADAVLDMHGRVLHAKSPDAREHISQLHHAAVSRFRARSSLRTQDFAAAVALWRAMVQGEWTLVDHFDTDGRRFLLARRNRPGVGEPGALTLRERQVAIYTSFGCPLKQTAYELGLSLPVVSLALKAALRKLRLQSRAELVAMALASTNDSKH